MSLRTPVNQFANPVGQVANLRTDCQSVPASKARPSTARVEVAQ
jgi:hypothetical protein